MSADQSRPTAGGGQGSHSSSSHQAGRGENVSFPGGLPYATTQAFENPSNPLQPQSASFEPPPIPVSLNSSTSLTTAQSTLTPLSYNQTSTNLTYSTRANAFVSSNGNEMGALKGVAHAGGFRIDYELNTGFSRERDGAEVYSLWAN